MGWPDTIAAVAVFMEKIIILILYSSGLRSSGWHLVSTIVYGRAAHILCPPKRLIRQEMSLGHWDNIEHQNDMYLIPRMSDKSVLRFMHCIMLVSWAKQWTWKLFYLCHVLMDGYLKYAKRKSPILKKRFFFILIYLFVILHWNNDTV